MRNPARRWAVLLVAVLTAAGACYWVYDLERQSLAVRSQALASEGHVAALDQAVADARRALAAMASPGQAAVSWSRQATAALDTTRVHLTALAATPQTTGVGLVMDVLDKLVDAAGRVREHAVNGKPLMASDVAFGEALPLLDTVQGAVGAARTRVAAQADGAMMRLRGQQVLGVAGALAVLLLAGFVLVALPAPRVELEGAGAIAASPASDHLSLGLGAVAPAVPQAAATSSVDLEALAAVCGQLAATTSEAGVSGALAHLATTLGASGLVVWLADRGERVLTVAASTGYDPKIVARFGTVPFDDGNPTSRAAATGLVVTSPASAGQTAALAVPMSGPDGLVGVLSAELGATAVSPAVAAAARIAAAQLAAVIGPAAPVEARDDDRQTSVTGH